jgi:hypothetical protein
MKKLKAYIIDVPDLYAVLAQSVRQGLLIEPVFLEWIFVVIVKKSLTIIAQQGLLQALLKNFSAERSTAIDSKHAARTMRTIKKRLVQKLGDDMGISQWIGFFTHSTHHFNPLTLN